ncbi:hypothetical protein E2320_006314 [Naja naja]|nr:hypothetical protein E2320_006314 [Naja naja]
MRDFWVVNNSIQSTIILLIEQIVVALGGEFKLYLPQLIRMPGVFMHDSSSSSLLNAIQLFGANLDDYLHLLLPPIVKLFDAPDAPLSARKAALETVDRLTESLDFTDYASRIIHPIVRTLDQSPELATAMDTLSSLVFQLGKKEIQATWYEKLHEWEDALVAYDKKMDTNKDDPDASTKPEISWMRN